MNVGDKRYAVLLVSNLISVAECEIVQLIPPAPWAGEWAVSSSKKQKEYIALLDTEEGAVYVHNLALALEGGAFVRIVTREGDVLERLSMSQLGSFSDAVIDAQGICYETIDNAVDSLAQIRMLEQRILAN